MIKTTYIYSFLELSGKPKRFLESKVDCKILGYGVSTDTVTLSVLYENMEAFTTLSKSLHFRFGLLPEHTKHI
jgi:hypothetical protein